MSERNAGHEKPTPKELATGVVVGVRANDPRDTPQWEKAQQDNYIGAPPAAAGPACIYAYARRGGYSPVPRLPGSETTRPA